MNKKHILAEYPLISFMMMYNETVKICLVIITYVIRGGVILCFPILYILKSTISVDNEYQHHKYDIEK